jgi:hypothetical protein
MDDGGGGGISIVIDDKNEFVLTMWLAWSFDSSPSYHQLHMDETAAWNPHTDAHTKHTNASLSSFIKF